MSEVRYIATCCFQEGLLCGIDRSMDASLNAKTLISSRQKTIVFRRSDAHNLPTKFDSCRIHLLLNCIKNNPLLEVGYMSCNFSKRNHDTLNKNGFI